MLSKKTLSLLCSLTLFFTNNPPINANNTLTKLVPVIAIVGTLNYCAHRANKAKPLLTIPSDCEFTLKNIQSNFKGVFKYSIIGNRQRSHNPIGSKPFPIDQPNPNNLKYILVHNDIPGRGIGWIEDRLKEFNDATGISKDLALFLLVAKEIYHKGYAEACKKLLSNVFKIILPA